MSHQNAGNPAQVYPYGPTQTQTVDIRDPVDTLPSESQPPGVDEPPRPEEEVATTLEEALTTL